MNCSWYFSRVVPPENVNNWALIDGMVRVYYLWSRESKKGIDGYEDNADGIIVNGTSPLEIVICCNRKGGSDITFPERREGSIIGLMDEGKVGVGDLETS